MHQKMIIENGTKSKVLEGVRHRQTCGGSSLKSLSWVFSDVARLQGIRTAKFCYLLCLLFLFPYTFGSELAIAQSSEKPPDASNNLSIRRTLSENAEFRVNITAQRIADSGHAWEVDWRASSDLYFYAVLDALVPLISTSDAIPFGVNRDDGLAQGQLDFIYREFINNNSQPGYFPIIEPSEIENCLQSEAYRSASRDVKVKLLEDKIRVSLRTKLYEPIKNGLVINPLTRITYINEVLKKIISFNNSPHRLKSDAELHKVLDIAEKAWQSTQFTPELRVELERLTVIVINNTDWTPSDVSILKRYADVLRTNDSYQNALLVESKIYNLEGNTPWYKKIAKVWVIHLLFWLVLIFAYPKFPSIEAIFFWNPWVRRLMGLGYVGFALSWVPFLRSKLFAPFKESLQSDASLVTLTAQRYYEQSKVRHQVTGQLHPINEAISEIKGQIVLEGESGLGKSMFLRHLVKHSKRIAVYLPAEKCAGGVIQGIQAKLHGLAQDEKFLRNLIYSGAIDICIDGLNEVTSDTRAKIVNFAESYFKGNIIMATQPLEWKPPATASVYVLQPLAINELKEFLLFYEHSLPEDATISTTEYQTACTTYLAEVINEKQPDESLSAVKRVLSNPMDLSVVANILARGKKPNLFRLLEQQYKIMATDYEHVNVGHTFPLTSFSEKVYKMRLDNESTLPSQGCLAELECMRRHKMVIVRQHLDAEKQPVTEWYFRHDKIMEFFVVQTFLGVNNSKPLEHLGDPRFRGVYLLLAMLMPLKEAEVLREQLIQYAADTRDHTVSDTFVQLLRSRQSIAQFAFR